MNRASIPPISFRDQVLEQRIDVRRAAGAATSPGRVAKRDLRRLYDLLDAELRLLDLSEHEALMICDALHGIIIVDDRWKTAWAMIADGVAGRDLAAKWGIAESEANALVDRIRAAPPSTNLALCDAVERFWIALQRSPSRDPSITLREVGLTATSSDTAITRRRTKHSQR